ncbi:hypothetical protein [Mucilaginibacter terrae]|nr:hypothetical protein [Mucilaginibacter terrae]
MDEIVLPDGWLNKAAKLNQMLLNAADDKERQTIIEKNQIWKQLFVPLSELSKGKCWYSEALDVMSDRDIDHFRPKGIAKNIKGIKRADEDGYWWLAYDYENYRFSSQYSNEPRRDKFDSAKVAGGKWVYFPLFEGSFVAKNKPRCKDEEIMLLDPCDADDPNLLTFDSKGKAIANAPAILDVRDKIRVETSIKLYHLDHTPLEELRERVWDFCQRMVDEIRTISNDPEGISNFGRYRVKFLKDEIRRLTKRDVQLSAVAIACCEENGLAFISERR